ncbi:hypothetical protein B484DRAFT_398276 [Ochromonadaceae sp. CCMP2298]|nr:hypothetical protein B484DRAFT_398276 [Ochromonadaceae sp. CCMP2298]
MSTADTATNLHHGATAAEVTIVGAPPPTAERSTQPAPARQLQAPAATPARVNTPPPALAPAPAPNMESSSVKTRRSFFGFGSGKGEAPPAQAPASAPQVRPSAAPPSSLAAAHAQAAKAQAAASLVLDDAAVRQLCGMGFSMAAAKMALRRANNRPALAANFLLEQTEEKLAMMVAADMKAQASAAPDAKGTMTSITQAQGAQGGQGAQAQTSPPEVTPASVSSSPSPTASQMSMLQPAQAMANNPLNLGAARRATESSSEGGSVSPIVNPAIAAAMAQVEARRQSLRTKTPPPQQTSPTQTSLNPSRDPSPVPGSDLDPASLQALTAMGFTSPVAVLALRRANGQLPAAAQFLLEHSPDQIRAMMQEEAAKDMFLRHTAVSSPAIAAVAAATAEVAAAVVSAGMAATVESAIEASAPPAEPSADEPTADETCEAYHYH